MTDYFQCINESCTYNPSVVLTFDDIDDEKKQYINKRYFVCQYCGDRLAVPTYNTSWRSYAKLLSRALTIANICYLYGKEKPLHTIFYKLFEKALTDPKRETTHAYAMLLISVIYPMFKQKRDNHRVDFG